MDETELKSGIYQLTWDNGYFYIGQSKNLIVRWKYHNYSFLNGHMLKHQRKLYNVWKKHGTPKFKIILFCPCDLLDNIEQACISIHWENDKLCNTNPLATSSRGSKRSVPPYNKGLKMSDDQKSKISKTKKGNCGGEKHPCCKLTENKIKEIRDKYERNTHNLKELSKEYLVTRTQISHIVKRRLWKYVL